LAIALLMTQTLKRRGKRKKKKAKKNIWLDQKTKKSPTPDESSFEAQEIVEFFFNYTRLPVEKADPYIRDVFG